MPKLVQFGAGNIGRGFIAPTFASAGWEIVFVEVVPGMLARLNRRGGYTVHEVDNEGTLSVPVVPVRAVDGRDLDAVVTEIVDAGIVATAVGLGALKHLGEPLARGLERRGRKLDILICENGAQAPAILKEAIEAAATGILPPVGYVRTSIGRMVPPPREDEDPLDLRVEPYRKLPVDGAAFVDAVPEAGGLVAKANFDLVIDQKLYLHNMTHACLAYTGVLRGYGDVPTCMGDHELVASVRAAAEVVGEALALTHGDSDGVRAEIRAECRDIVDDLFVRYTNRALADPLERVARDPIRKLAGDDRLVGAARLCRARGLKNPQLCLHILDACRYACGPEDPAKAIWPSRVAKGWKQCLMETAGLDPQEDLMSDLDLAARQKESAQLMRDAGIHLKDDEVGRIEIAELGLGRYEEIGLGIYVYVNTDRCCAKELTLLPGQLCPEHRHPDVDGEPGKEETFRCRGGEVHLFLPGDDSPEAKAFALQFVPEDKKDCFTVFRHVHLKPGDQCTLPPDTLHWFVADPKGPAVVSEFSTKSRDEADIFTDREIQRVEG